MLLLWLSLFVIVVVHDIIVIDVVAETAIVFVIDVIVGVFLLS